MAMRAPPYPATMADIDALPPHVVGEIIDGTLYTQARPRFLHASAATVLGQDLGSPFQRGRGGPGGWLFLDEPELHFGANVLVPDMAGWRRERMPELPLVAWTDLAPDWLCEVLSPSTSAKDRGPKLRCYGDAGVPYVWFVDPEAQTLEVLRLDGVGYRIAHVFGGDAIVRAEPFDAIELELAALWSR